VVENVPGAGGLITANTLASAIAPDGLTLGYLPAGVLFAQLLGTSGVRYDLRRFESVGAPTHDWPVCAVSKRSGVASIAQWRASTRPLRIGATGSESATSLLPALLSAMTDLPLRIIGGYRGSAEIRFAMASGEVDGVCQSWNGIKTGWPASAGPTPVLQSGTSARPDLPAVPLAWTLSRHPEAKSLLGELFDAAAAASRFYALPPGTPPNRRDLLRRAFADTMQDPAYLDEARAVGMTPDPVSGDPLTGRIKAFLDLPPPLVNTLQQALPR
jgi:tripartite-type tricarboxylate transporter receptor subunit TctC